MRTWILTAALAALSQPLWADNAARPLGEPVLEMPTLYSLGVYWVVGGDDNKNATVELQYRVAGTKDWYLGMPLFRVDKGAWRNPDAEPAVKPPQDAWLFAGSLFQLRPETEYEMRLLLRDPDGGDAERVLKARTLSEPVAPADALQVHVVPGNGAGNGAGRGTAADPFRGLAAAQAHARPGCICLVHAGLYPATFEVNRSGEPGRPIIWRGAGDGEAVIAGPAGPQRIERGVAASGVHDVWFENLTLRHTQWGLVAHDSARIVVRRCHMADVCNGLTAARNRGDVVRGFFIADNVIEGVYTWPKPESGPEDQEYRGIEIGGAGHDIGFNRVRGFKDGIDAYPGSRCEAIDIHNNEVSECRDDGCEMDGSYRNTRCFLNRFTNIFQGISVQPVYGGPVWVFRNALYNIQVEPFKLHNQPSGALFLHNTCVKRGMEALLWTNESPHRIIFRNNLFIGTDDKYAGEFIPKMVDCDFDYDGFAAVKCGNFLKWNGVRYPTFEAMKAGAPVERHATLLDARTLFASGVQTPGDYRTQFDVKVNDLRLKEGAGAVDAGELLPGLNDDFAGNAPDQGAYELGAPLPYCGPRPVDAAQFAAVTQSNVRQPKLLAAATAAAGAAATALAGPSGGPVGVVSHVKVLCDKVPDVSSLEAWKAWAIKPGMTEEEKAIAVWQTVLRFRQQDVPPNEWLGDEGNVHDAIKTFNVYGYGMCCCASSNIECLARYAGLEARGRGGFIGHSLPEVFYDGAWHVFDASLLVYFPKADGKIAGVDEICAGVQDWLAKNPDYRRNGGKLMQFAANGGWRKGPEVLSRCPFYDDAGFAMAGTHGWFSTMQEYDCGTPYVYEYGYSQGYQVNVQLRPGERLTRNWFNSGLHVNMMEGAAPGCLYTRVGEGDLAYARRWGDLAPGRVGSGMVEYEPPLADPDLRLSALEYDNLATRGQEARAPALHVKDRARPGVLTLRMPSSYVYLSGELALTATIPAGGSVDVLLSDNNGLDWKQALALTSSGRRILSLTPWVMRRYDYRLKVVLRGQGTGLEALRITHDVQCSQRALPALGQGKNTITFSAEPAEGTISVEGATNADTCRGRNLMFTEFHPALDGCEEQFMRVGDTGRGSVTFPLSTPGDITRLRFGCHYRARDARDGWDAQVSFDGGKTFKTVERFSGPTQGKGRYLTVSNVPPGTRQALVRFSGVQYNTTCTFNFRLDADYLEPKGGFRPVKVTYVWAEDGAEKRDVHVAQAANETYEITCAGRPEMRSVAVELAQ